MISLSNSVKQFLKFHGLILMFRGYAKFMGYMGPVQMEYGAMTFLNT